jgi:hypothetical protein
MRVLKCLEVISEFTILLQHKNVLLIDSVFRANAITKSNAFSKKS